MSVQALLGIIIMKLSIYVVYRLSQFTYELTNHIAQSVLLLQSAFDVIITNDYHDTYHHALSNPML